MKDVISEMQKEVKQTGVGVNKLITSGALSKRSNNYGDEYESDESEPAEDKAQQNKVKDAMKISQETLEQDRRSTSEEVIIIEEDEEEGTDRTHSLQQQDSNMDISNQNLNIPQNIHNQADYRRMDVRTS